MKSNKKPIPAARSNPAAKPFVQEVSQGFLQRNAELFLLALLIIFTALIFSPALHNTFTNWDDNDYVTENQYIRTLSGSNLEYIFTRPVALNYHPLTILSLALNYKFSGTEPYSYFLVNIILHLCNVILAFYFALMVLDRNKPMALFVAAIFAIHPMHVESVAWISERKDVLYAFFFLSGLISWIYFLRKRGLTWYLFALVLFILSGLSKPSSVVFPLVLFLMDFYFRRKVSLGLFMEKIPFFLISAAIGIATLQAQVGKSVVDIRHFNALQQLLFASYGFFIYQFKLIVPVGLSALHQVPVFNTSLDLPRIYFAAPVINILVIVFAVYSLKYTRLFLFGLLFYFLNIILTLQFLQVGSAVIAERYTYVSYIGLLLAIGWLIQTASGKFRIPMGWFYILMLVFFGIASVLCLQRVRIWKNSGTLWTNVIDSYPDSYTAYNNRGYYYVQQKIMDKALEDFNRSLELQPSFVDALNNRGSLYRLQKQPRLAINDYSSALLNKPDHVRALAGRGNAYATLGILDSALSDYNKAYDLDPLLAGTLCDRGSVYFRLGQFDNAIAECSRKIDADPGNPATYLNRGVAYSSLNKWDLAIRDYSVYLKSVTDNPTAYEWRGVAYRNNGSLKLAIDDFTMGIRLNPGLSSLYVNRALTLKMAGSDREASDDIKMARRLGANVTEQSIFDAR